MRMQEFLLKVVLFMRTYTYNPFKERRDKIFLVSLIIAFILYLAFSITYFSSVSGEIRENVVRLHILAESDSEIDQQVKLKVRDALLKKNTELLSSKVTPENAEEYFKNSKDELEKCANEVLKENGFDYTAKITLGKEYYTTRTYEDLTFPAGTYTSVKVVLGSGEGKNWWCVMFPPLCVSVATGGIETDDGVNLEEYLDEDGKRIVMSEGKFKVGFKVVEWYEKLFK
ncbi:MAG: stage II sporulation protein R [Ruminococcaceae bacterium]|nr:stage II sporulation protein R [Oscillospiraceae bacterium]